MVSHPHQDTKAVGPVHLLEWRLVAQAEKLGR